MNASAIAYYRYMKMTRTPFFLTGNLVAVITDAVVTGGGQVYAMRYADILVKVDGQWMQGLGAQEAGLKMAAPMMMKLTPLATVLETWAADVSANKFADPQAAAADLSAKAMPALQGLIPGGG